MSPGRTRGSVHGANRRVGNGVAESTIIWAIVGDVMYQYVQGRSQPEIGPAQVESFVGEVLRPFSLKGDENIHAIRQEIEALMSNKGGLVRNGPYLASALAELDQLEERAWQAPIPEVKEFNLS